MELIKKVRREFSELEEILIRKHLASFIKNKTASLRKHEFLKTVRKIPELTDLLNEIGIDKFIVKIRTERKKY